MFNEAENCLYKIVKRSQVCYLHTNKYFNFSGQNRRPEDISVVRYNSRRLLTMIYRTGKRGKVRTSFGSICYLSEKFLPFFTV